MSSICSSCGASSSGAAFCTSCGAAMANSFNATAAESSDVTEDSSFFSVSTEELTEEEESPSKDSRNKKMLMIGASLVLFFGTALGSFLGGKSSVDLKKEQKISFDSGFKSGDSAGYDRGYSAGDSAGYDRGDSAGYDRGYSAGDSVGYDRGDSAGYDRGYSAGHTAGCEYVFDNAGYSDYLIGYNPYNSYYRYGRTYVSKSDC